MCGIPAGSQGILIGSHKIQHPMLLLYGSFKSINAGIGLRITSIVLLGSCGIPVGSHGIPHPGASILLPAWACVWDPSWIPQDPTRSHFLRFCMAPSSRVVSSIAYTYMVFMRHTYTAYRHVYVVVSIWRVYPQTSAVCRYLVIWCMRIRILWDLLSTYPSADTDCIHASDGRLSAAGTGLTDSR